MQNTITSKIVAPLKIGELLVNEGLIHPVDIDTALSIQKDKTHSLVLNKPRLLGMILCNLNLITPKDNYFVLHKYNKLMSIKAALIGKNILSKELVLKIDQESQQQGTPFISCLLKSGLISMTKMQQLLFDLFHIPFKSISDFIFYQKDKTKLIQILDENTARKTRIVPLVLKNNTILFGITDPDNILFLGKLNDQFPQYRFKTLFISFSDYLNILKIVYDTNKEPGHSLNDKSLDLSLLLNFKTFIQNPETENKSIKALYERYELLRQLSGNSKRENYFNKFYDFIMQSHKTIAEQYKKQNIQFSLQQQGSNVKIIAFPK